MASSRPEHDEYSEIFDIRVSKKNMEETIRFLLEQIEKRRVTQVITMNPIMVMAALEQPDYKQILQQAELIVPDGAGVVWAAKRLGNPVSERVAGIDLMMKLLAEAEKRQFKVYFLGASSEVIHQAVANLIKRFPRLSIAGYRDGYFTDSDDEAVIRDIKDAKPDMLFLGRSANQQEPWIHRHKSVLEVPVMMGVGGSYDVLSGKLKRAPKIWQSLKLEWLYRLIQEPWRYKRMLEIPKFMWQVLKKR